METSHTLESKTYAAAMARDATGDAERIIVGFVGAGSGDGSQGNPWAEARPLI